MPFNAYFLELYIPPSFYLTHSIFAESRYSLSIRSIAIPPKNNFLQNGIPNVVLESFLNVLEPQINPNLTPPPLASPPVTHRPPYNVVAPSHGRFYFLNSLSLFSKYRHIHIFSQDSYTPPLFFWSDLRNPPLNHTQYFGLESLTRHQPLFVFCYNQLQHLLPCSFISGLYYPSSPYTILRWRERRRTCQLSTSSRNFEECLDKAGIHTWRKRSQKENRKPVPGNGIRLLLFDKCKFTKPFKWKKCWTRQTTHWSHIYQL